MNLSSTRRVLIFLVTLLAIVALCGMPIWTFASAWGWGPTFYATVILVALIAIVLFRLDRP